MSDKPQPKLYELINPSDPYTFYASSIEVAGACTVILSTGFGAKPVDGEGPSTPVMFGWNEWLKERGIDDTWLDEHLSELAECYESFLIGDAAKRADVESMLAMLPEDKRQEWRDQRQDRYRSSLNQIGEAAYSRARAFRATLAKRQTEQQQPIEVPQ
jgi:hypothetical protein